MWWITRPHCGPLAFPAKFSMIPKVNPFESYWCESDCKGFEPDDSLDDSLAFHRNIRSGCPHVMRTRPVGSARGDLRINRPIKYELADDSCGIEAASIDWGMDDRTSHHHRWASRHRQNEASMFAKSHSPKSDFQKVSQNLLLRNVHWMIRFESLRIALRICVRSSQVAQVEKMKVNSPPFDVDETPRSWREKLSWETELRSWKEKLNWETEKRLRIEMLETLRHSNWSLEWPQRIQHSVGWWKLFINLDILTWIPSTRSRIGSESNDDDHFSWSFCFLRRRPGSDMVKTQLRHGQIYGQDMATYKTEVEAEVWKFWKWDCRRC